MINRLIKYTEIALISLTTALFVVLAFKGPRFLNSENTNFDAAFESAESINYLFRTLLFLILPSILIWRLARPNKMLKILSLFIVIITWAIFLLDLKGILHYQDIFILRKFEN